MTLFLSGRFFRTCFLYVSFFTCISMLMANYAKAFDQYHYSRQQVLVAIFTKLSYQKIQHSGHVTEEQANLSSYYITPKLRVTPRQGFNLSVANTQPSNDVEFLSNLSPAAGKSESYQLGYDISHDDDVIGPKLSIEVENRNNIKQFGVEATSSLTDKWNVAVAGIHQSIQSLDPNEAHENNSIVQLGLKYRY